MRNERLSSKLRFKFHFELHWKIFVCRKPENAYCKSEIFDITEMFFFQRGTSNKDGWQNLFLSIQTLRASIKYSYSAWNFQWVNRFWFPNLFSSWIPCFNGEIENANYFLRKIVNFLMYSIRVFQQMMMRGRKKLETFINNPFSVIEASFIST